MWRPNWLEHILVDGVGVADELEDVVDGVELDVLIGECLIILSQQCRQDRNESLLAWLELEGPTRVAIGFGRVDLVHQVNHKSDHLVDVPVVDLASRQTPALLAL